MPLPYEAYMKYITSHKLPLGKIGPHMHQGNCLLLLLSLRQFGLLSTLCFELIKAGLSSCCRSCVVSCFPAYSGHVLQHENRVFV